MTARCQLVPLHGSWPDDAGSTGVHLSWTQPHVRASTHMHRVHRSYPQRATPSSQRATCNALSPAHNTRFSECTNVCVDACRHRCRSSTGLEVGDPPPSSVCMCVCRQHRGKEEEEEEGGGGSSSPPNKQGRGVGRGELASLAKAPSRRWAKSREHCAMVALSLRSRLQSG